MHYINPQAAPGPECVRFGGGACGSYWRELYFLAEARVAPSKYGAFLENMSRRTLLRRGGRSYFFVHRLLRDHLGAKAAIMYADILTDEATDPLTSALVRLRPRMRSDVMGRFTEGSRELMDRAQEEARQRNHERVTPSHTLLAMIDDHRDGNAAETLLTPSQIREIRLHLYASMRPGSETIWGDLALTMAAKRVFQLAYLEARRLDCKAIDCEHVLLGLIRGADVAVSDIFGNVDDVDLDRMRRKVAACSDDDAG